MTASAQASEPQPAAGRFASPSPLAQRALSEVAAEASAARRADTAGTSAATTGSPAARPANAPSAPPLPTRPAAKSWPKTVPEAKAEAAGPSPAVEAWTPAEIAEAKARCTAQLKGIPAAYVPAEPIRQGECGAPAPVELVSIGRAPEVVFSPPVVVTCDMVVALERWVRSDLQPLARSHLGASIIKIETMSSYSCRNAYGRAKTRLSEHGRANAVDVRGFLAASGVSVAVLSDWGMTEREIRIAAEKAEAERNQAAAAKPPLAPPAAVGGPQRIAKPTEPPAPTVGATGSVLDSIPTVTVTVPRIRAPEADAAYGLAPQSRLGGPKPQAKAEAKPASPPQRAAPSATELERGKSRFLREAHTTACAVFGTVLGPEANNAHKNHFHFDMAERKSGSYCE